MNSLNVVERVRQGQDMKAMNIRLIEQAIKLYADKTHFIYELLQNAEDAGATRVSFFQHENHLEVMHDGKPFTMSNLQSLCDAANSDKIHQHNQIGKFGIGFKSVFAICKSVKLYSEPSHRYIEDALPRIAIKIDNYIDPDYISEEWHLEKPYTTKFIFHYDANMYGKPIELLRIDIAIKLRRLGASVLLFLKNIEQIDYRIIGIGKDYDASNIYMLERQVLGEGISKINTLGDDGGINSYLIFSKRIKETERSVDIAFSIRTEEAEGKMNFINASSPYISSYFPTEVESRLNFIVQAPFDLTPNRSSLEKDTKHNDELFKLIELLFVETLYEIKNRNWLSLEFINLLPYNIDNALYIPGWTFYSLHKKIFDLLNNESIIPAFDGSYVRARDAKIVRGAKLLSLFDSEKLCILLNNPDAKWLCRDFTENSPLRDLHGFFIKTLGAKEISSNDLASLLRANSTFLTQVDENWLVSFYEYLANDVRNLLGKNGDLATVSFVKTSEGDFQAPYTSRKIGRTTEIESNIYIRPSSAISSVEGFHFIDENIAVNCLELIKALGLTEPDSFTYFVKELGTNKENNKNDDIVNLSQVKKAIKYLDEGQENACDILTGLLFLKVFNSHDSRPCFTTEHNRIYRENDYNGVSLKHYFSYTQAKYDPNVVYILDEEFYRSDGAFVESNFKSLELLGVKNNVYENINEITWRDGNTNCQNLDEFRKNLTFTNITSVLDTIKSDHYKNEFKCVKTRSNVIFSLVKNVEEHLQGVYKYGSTKQELREGFSRIVEILRGESLYKSFYYKWLVNTSGDLVSPSEISRFDLDADIYGKVDKKSDIYEILGFKKTETDKQEEIVRDFISRFTQYSSKQREAIIQNLLPKDTSEIFDPDVDEDYVNFPDEPIVNLHRLQEKIVINYQRARIVRYEDVRRRVRVSRGPDKEHIRHRYRGYCQLCEEPSPYWEIAEIFLRPQKELSEMNLSLCPNCASEYRQLREQFSTMNKFRTRIINANVVVDSCIEIADKYVRFTQKHLAEIQQILKMEDKTTQ